MKRIASLWGILFSILPLTAEPVAAQDVYSLCLEKSRTYGLSSEQVVIVCQGATSYIPLCLDGAWSYGLRGTQLARVCRLARENSASCIQAAWSHTLRGEQIVEVCKTLEPCSASSSQPTRIYYDYPPYPIIPKR